MADHVRDSDVEKHGGDGTNPLALRRRDDRRGEAAPVVHEIDAEVDRLLPHDRPAEDPARPPRHLAPSAASTATAAPAAFVAATMDCASTWLASTICRSP